MPSYFINRRERHRIRMEPFDGSDQWFEVSAQRSHTDKLALSDALLVYDTGVARLQQREQFERLILRTVKAWSFEGPDGRLAPINSESIEALGPEVGAFMAREIDAFYTSQERSEDEKKETASRPSNGVWERDLSPTTPLIAVSSLDDGSR